MDACSRSGSSFRAGDLTDTQADTQENLEVPGAVFLLTPQQGVEGFVEPAGITTTAKTARLTPATSLAISKEWTATCLNTATAGAVSTATNPAADRRGRALRRLADPFGRVSPGRGPVGRSR
ncbi:DUF3052 family protein [Streptomyces sp. NBC_00696]|uniref:DUF3052 family protein n=1 Tax=Streptomyces sp. NBC_00696 TaxID=2903672 RepID=UPI003FA7CF31